jgi:ferric-chelate reductase [NAD(P)H]
MGANELSEIDPTALFSMSYGMYIVSSRLPEKLNGQVANAAMQTTAAPATVCVCLNRENLTETCVRETGLFAVSVLQDETPMPFIGTFGFKSGRDIDKFTGVDYIMGDLNIPIVKEWCLSALEAKVTGILDLKTHTLFVGEIVSTRSFKVGSPLTYANYHLIKRGKSPKTAPTFAFNNME